MRNVVTAVAVALAASAVTAGCGGQGGDKAGAQPAPVPTKVTLHLPDSTDVDGLYFADALGRRSNGTLVVDVDSETFPSIDPRRELGLVGSLADGTADLGYLPARDWAEAGAPAFEALQTPFVVTSSAASVALARSPVAGEIAASLDSLGVVGLGLVAHEPRRLFSTRPLLALADLAGLRVRVVDNGGTASLVTALGGVPVQGLSSSETGQRLASGEIDAVESSPEYVAASRYQVAAPYVTAFAVLPKIQTIAASERWWNSLTTSQQAAVRAAVADTVVHAADTAARESSELATLCRDGAVITRPDGSALDAIAARATPAADADVLPWRDRLAAAVADADPQALDIPAGCTVATSASAATTAHDAAVGSATFTPGVAGPPLPDGTFTTTTTVDDLRAGGVNGPDWSRDITWTFTFDHGRAHYEQKPTYTDQPPCDGTYETSGDLVRFTWASACGVAPETVRWSYLDGTLTFEVVDVADNAGKVIYTAHPWRRVG